MLNRNFMNMRDATSGKVLWEASDWGNASVFTEEKRGVIFVI